MRSFPGQPHCKTLPVIGRHFSWPKVLPFPIGNGSSLRNKAASSRFKEAVGVIESVNCPPDDAHHVSLGAGSAIDAVSRLKCNLIHSSAREHYQMSDGSDVACERLAVPLDFGLKEFISICSLPGGDFVRQASQQEFDLPDYVEYLGEFDHLSLSPSCSAINVSVDEDGRCRDNGQDASCKRGVYPPQHCKVGPCAKGTIGPVLLPAGADMPSHHEGDQPSQCRPNGNRAENFPSLIHRAPHG